MRPSGFVVLLLLVALADAQLVAVQWYAPFLADSGFGSEATSFVEALLRLPTREQILVQAINFAERAQFPAPRSISPAFRPVAPMTTGKKEQAPLFRVSICHSTPNFWATPASDYPSWDRVAKCPPKDGSLAIGRSMFETNALPKDWVWRLQYMDYVWVPTEFAKQIYIAGGVSPSKLVVVPEPVNVHVFNSNHCAKHRSHRFTFLSIFKWEERKAWPVLLDAFAKEFKEEEQVSLRIKTSSFHASPPPVLLHRDARIQFDVDHRVEEHELVSEYYCKADAFVLASSGEGWGRGHAEAASMGLPVIYTNFSGPAEFLNERVGGMPVEYDLVESSAIPQGHRWAMPRLDSLRRAMRRVYEERGERNWERGKSAAKHMRENYSQEVVGELVARALLRAREEMHACADPKKMD